LRFSANGQQTKAQFRSSKEPSQEIGAAAGSTKLVLARARCVHVIPPIHSVQPHPDLLVKTEVSGMTVEIARGFFLWCSIINYAILLFWAVPLMFWRDGLYRLWGRWFRLSAEQFDMLNIGGITFYKISIFLFNIVPCIALYIVD
jgi:hypothetical protein